MVTAHKCVFRTALSAQTINIQTPTQSSETNLRYLFHPADLHHQTSRALRRSQCPFFTSQREQRRKKGGGGEVQKRQ